MRALRLQWASSIEGPETTRTSATKTRGICHHLRDRKPVSAEAIAAPMVPTRSLRAHWGQARELVSECTHAYDTRTRILKCTFRYGQTV